MNKYKLGVVIPCWNCEKDLREMLESILAQTFQDWQLFCVDDRSTDDTQSVIREYSERDRRIHLFVRNREPKGAQTCRNIGFDLADGAEYLIWFDSDDVAAPYCFEQRVSYMDSHIELDFGIFPAKVFKNGTLDDTCWFYGFPIFEDSLAALLTWTLPMVGWTNIYRRTSLIAKEHKWDERLLSMQDSDFNIQGLLKGMRFDYASKEEAQIDYYYRSAEGHSVSRKIGTENHLYSHLYLLDKIVNSLSQEQLKKYNENIEIYFLKFACIFKFNLKLFPFFLNTLWVKTHHGFRMRLMLWRFFGFHFTYRLFFADIHRREKKATKTWSEYMKDVNVSNVHRQYNIH